MKKQHGMSFYGMCIALVIAVFFGMLAIKIVPVYVDNSLMRTAINKALDTQNAGMVESQIRDNISNSMLVNNITGPARHSVSVTSKNGRIIAQSNYEVRIPIVYNIDVIISFDDTYGDRP